MSSKCEFFSKIKIPKEKFATLIITIALEEYYRVAERLFYDDENCSINCDKEIKLLIKFCNVCGFDVDDYEDLWHDLLPKIPDYFEKKYGMDYYFFAIKNLANYKKIPK
ncbi:hypothetical protein ES705_33790 [subsurface metagenome]